ncbi:DUF302 domain-containing protein [Sulfuriflexus sp.]|uniref:DUF302 domain-containing protein n=1 Tax=Sulfuriflexus sp. TaxID=2015443 RepID=UPI0028CD9BC8|nr:DUF302 domain-containing protein [Sulfuriflexus sp.]MDT8404600.1 DUF302 domain-containing protein [Sulfuriflexus sp.]
MTSIRKLIITSILASAGLVLSACDVATDKAPAPADTATETDPYSHMSMRKVESPYEYVVDDIKNAIAQRGIKINNISHIGNMLTRTAEAVGATRQVFAQAEAIEFCSSTISRATMEADPHNIVFCPYIIAIYSLPGEEDFTYVSYRRPIPVGSDESKAALKAVEGLMEEIITSAVE